MEIPPDFLEEMDQEDPFGELFSIVGMAASPKAPIYFGSHSKLERMFSNF